LFEARQVLKNKGITNLVLIHKIVIDVQLNNTCLARSTFVCNLMSTSIFRGVIVVKLMPTSIDRTAMAFQAINFYANLMPIVVQLMSICNLPKGIAENIRVGMGL